MLDLIQEVDSEEFRKALSKAPKALVQNLSKSVNRFAIELGRSAKGFAPKAHSTLVNSIRHQRIGVLSYVVGPTVNYGPMVENETKPQGLPNVLSIYDWVRVSGLQPNNPKMDQMDLAWMISKSIAKKGTEAQPYMEPAVEEKSDRLLQLVQIAMTKTMKEVGVV